ncbi:hypothetical protein [Tropicibacter naphthalenivorans]|uniref:Lipoprotein n=1 Tax=Tropicibacter naphthalenivorans TaxID=441103 RepID=A0A0P1G918_9RHOB|nr:hypothetical protein [Tropicibacter naphthalenivorans]CUH78002.1 hypothetical protein TRN7648_01741 [Tropicibacter naphthalenivorans]SMC94260.1 hypothetical protein SAMN04488093_107101 [Tropicibacter naphthalenivorans]
MTRFARLTCLALCLTALGGCSERRNQMTLAEIGGQWFRIPDHRSAEALADPDRAMAIVREEQAGQWDMRPHVTTYATPDASLYADITCSSPEYGDQPCLP